MTTLQVSLQSHIAHEIRNYLDYINFNIEQLREKLKGNSDSSKQFFVIKTASENIEKLVWALNDVNCAPRMKKINLVELLWEQICLLESVFESKNINFSFDIPTTPIYINGDPRQLGRCIINFIKNAYEACKEGDSIKILAWSECGKAIIEIKDSGMGMSEEVRESLFTPFFTTKESGTGIGAYIAKTIIENHGGCVEVESVRGRGTTITVSLPIDGGDLCAPSGVDNISTVVYVP